MKRQKFRLFASLIACCALGFGAASAGSDSRIYRDRSLKIQFQLPLGWEVSNSSYSNANTKYLELRPKNQEKVPDPAVKIEIKHATLEQAVSGHVLFIKKGSVWFKVGRWNDEHEAVPIRGVDWNGFEASASCGISDAETGFHAAAGTCYTAILSDGSRSAVIENNGYDWTIDIATMVSKSFRFLQ